jgi:hypothetical protein
VPNGGWKPIVGDWDGNGTTGVGLYDPVNSTFYLTNNLEAGYAQYTFGYGMPNGGWTPVIGDWDNSGTTGVGLYDPVGSTFYLTNNLNGGYADITINFGTIGTTYDPLVGSWNSSATASAAVSTASETSTSLSARAVDQIDLAELVAQELTPKL